MPLVGGLPPLEEAAVEAGSKLLTQEEPTREGKGGGAFQKQRKHREDCRRESVKSH